MLEANLLQLMQWLLLPVLALLLATLLYALWMSGVVVMEGWQRRRGISLMPHAANLAIEEVELAILARLEPLRLLARVTPMLGLIATMIPLGPALQSVSGGEGHAALAVFSNAFAGVVLALATASLGLVLYSVRRRWLLAELVAIRRRQEAA